MISARARLVSWLQWLVLGLVAKGLVPRSYYSIYSMIEERINCSTEYCHCTIKVSFRTWTRIRTWSFAVVSRHAVDLTPLSNAQKAKDHRFRNRSLPPDPPIWGYLY